MSEKCPEGKKQKKHDIILICLIMLVAVCMILLLKLLARSGAYVVVYEDGVKTAEYSLSEDGRYTIETDAGVNVIVVSGGAAHMESADCPDLLCVHMGEIESQGENIICLPHKLVIQIEGGEEDRGYDIK